MSARYEIPTLRLEADLSKAEEYLKRAEEALDDENPKMAIKNSERAWREARGSIRKFREAWDTIIAAGQALERGGNLGYDISESLNLRDEAIKALNDKKYLRAIQLAGKAVEMTNPPPEPGDEIIINTDLRYSEGIYFYRVAVGNTYGHPIRNLKIRPQDFGGLFIPDAESKTIKHLRSDKWETVTFTLSPMNSELSEFEFMPGRDVQVMTKFSSQGGRLYYQVSIKNRLKEPLIDLKIYPFEPERCHADAPEKMIETLNPGEKKTVTFWLYREGEEPPPVEGEESEESKTEKEDEDGHVTDKEGIHPDLKAIRDWQLPWERRSASARDSWPRSDMIDEKETVGTESTGENGMIDGSEISRQLDMIPDAEKVGETDWGGRGANSVKPGRKEKPQAEVSKKGRREKAAKIGMKGKPKGWGKMSMREKAATKGQSNMREKTQEKRKMSKREKTANIVKKRKRKGTG